MAQRQDLIKDAIRIWTAGVEAVKPANLFANKLQLDDCRYLSVDGQERIDLAVHRKIIVVGAGKASAAMAVALWEQILSRLDPSRVAGWINAPQGTFDQQAAGPIQLYAARPAGLNEPTEAAVNGTGKILKLLRETKSDDLVIVLLSGGGSALLVAPPPGVTLTDKQSVARLIAAAGGDIEQLNCVRRALSNVKGGGLARATSAKRVLTFIISDVLGDNLQTIASGPTVTDFQVRPADALSVLSQLRLLNNPTLANCVNYLEQASRKPAESFAQSTVKVDNLVLANNATAVDAAGVKAVELGYSYYMQSAKSSEGDVIELSKNMADSIVHLLSEPRVDCFISGGEPTVKLPEIAVRGVGGRNQQLALLLMQQLESRGWPRDLKLNREFVFLSGGTDGEDGPTDAAGAWFNWAVAQRATQLGLSLDEYLNRADAYHFFQATQSLLMTGPTNTNVCDLRVLVAN